MVGPTTIWGRPQSYFWFAWRYHVPDILGGADLWLRIDAAFGRVMGRSDPQCLVRVNGEIAQGADYNHRLIKLTDNAVPGTQFDIMIEAGTIEDRQQIGIAGCVVGHPISLSVLFDARVICLGHLSDSSFNFDCALLKRDSFRLFATTLGVALKKPVVEVILSIGR